MFCFLFFTPKESHFEEQPRLRQVTVKVSPPPLAPLPLLPPHPLPAPAKHKETITARRSLFKKFAPPENARDVCIEAKDHNYDVLGVNGEHVAKVITNCDVLRAGSEWSKTVATKATVSVDRTVCQPCVDIENPLFPVKLSRFCDTVIL